VWSLFFSGAPVDSKHPLPFLSAPSSSFYLYTFSREVSGERAYALDGVDNISSAARLISHSALDYFGDVLHWPFLSAAYERNDLDRPDALIPISIDCA